MLSSLPLPDEDYIVIEVIYGNGREITPETHGGCVRAIVEAVRLARPRSEMLI